MHRLPALPVLVNMASSASSGCNSNLLVLHSTAHDDVIVAVDVISSSQQLGVTVVMWT
jgi:hypothetical protein